jgi:hypothetical protein
MELVLSAYARPDLLGQAVARGEAELGEARQQWGWSLIQTFTEVRRWLATLWRLILGAFQFLSPVSIPKAHQEASLVKDL